MRNKNQYKSIGLTIQYDKTNKSSPYRLYASLKVSKEYFHSKHFGSVSIFVEGKEYKSRLVCGPPKHKKGFDIGTKEISNLIVEYEWHIKKKITFKTLSHKAPFRLKALS